VSLVMMLMMVRRVSEGPVLPGEQPPERSQIIRIKDRRNETEEDLVVGDPPVGSAYESEQLMVGKEVDEATIRTRHVVEQVSALVRDDPDAAASILQRWVDSSKQ
jgi:hypothetical protein